MTVAAIHGDVMTALHEPARKLFGEGLETAIVRGNAARAQQGDSHAATTGGRLSDAVALRVGVRGAAFATGS